MSKIEKFLERIGLSKDEKVSLTYDFLKKIQFASVTSLAYENLDILEGKALKLDHDSLFEKIVLSKKGGYCFELNGLFSYILKECGFEVTDYFARYLRGESEIPMRRHRVMGARCMDGRTYFCDIGVGQSSPRYPVLMEEGIVQEQFGETYKFEKDRDLGWILYDLYKGEWREFISFTEEKIYEVDFIQPSVYCELHPDSPFNKEPMIAIKTEKGRETIDGKVYKVFEGDELVHIEENIGSERYEELLKGAFRLSI